MPDLRALGLRLDGATSPERDRAVDALRALAVAGVVLGHWLVTAVVDLGGGRLAAASPLKSMPALAPISWVFQTLAVFFLVGGYSAARSWASAGGRGDPYLVWLKRRLDRLFTPVGLLLVTWTIGVGVLVALEAPTQTVRTVLTLVLSPLWFLVVFAVITAATPLLVRSGSRGGHATAIAGAVVVAAVDLARFALEGPAWLGWANVLAGWLVPFGIGAAWAGGAWRGHRSAAGLLAGGLGAMVISVVFLGYPAGMVGVPGEPISNLNPPTLAAVAFGGAQCGLSLLLCEPLRRGMRRPVAWAVVALVNLSAMIVFLWHQTALLSVTLGTRVFGAWPGLHTPPDDLTWVALRLAWLPAFAAALAVLWAACTKLERPRALAPSAEG